MSLIWRFHCTSIQLVYRLLPLPQHPFTFPGPLPVVDVNGGPHEVVTSVSSHPYGFHRPTSLRLVRGVASESTEGCKLEDVGPGTSSARRLVHVSIRHTSQ